MTKRFETDVIHHAMSRKNISIVYQRQSIKLQLTHLPMLNKGKNALQEKTMALFILA